MAVAILSKVRDRDESRTVGFLLAPAEQMTG